MVHKNSIPLQWRNRKSKYGLIGSVCEKCNTKQFPPRVFCCDANSKETFLARSGEIVSFTMIYAAPVGFEDETPYNVALIKLDDGPVISARVVNNEKLEIGKRVTSVFRRGASSKGIINYGLKFELE